MSLRSFKDPYERQAELEKENLALDDELKAMTKAAKKHQENSVFLERELKECNQQLADCQMWNKVCSKKVDELRGIIENLDTHLAKFINTFNLTKRQTNNISRFIKWLIRNIESLEEGVKDV